MNRPKLTFKQLLGIVCVHLNPSDWSIADQRKALRVYRSKTVTLVDLLRAMNIASDYIKHPRMVEIAESLGVKVGKAKQ